jgi:uncharacterized membrane protein
MRIVSMVGVVLVLLGVLSFVVPVPHSEDHSIKIGDSRFGVQTHHSEKLPTAASITLIGAGILAIFLGTRRA